jgi:hypothetical protein
VSGPEPFRGLRKSARFLLWNVLTGSSATCQAERDCENALAAKSGHRVERVSLTPHAYIQRVLRHYQGGMVLRVDDNIF